MLSEAKIVSVFPYSVSPYVLKRDIVLIKRVCFSRSLNKTNSQLTAVCVIGVSEMAMTQQFEVCNLLEASCLILFILSLFLTEPRTRRQRTSAIFSVP